MNDDNASLLDVFFSRYCTGPRWMPRASLAGLLIVLSLLAPPNKTHAEDDTTQTGSNYAETDSEASGNDESATLPTMVVTGEKVERSLKNTAASVSVLSAEDLDDKKGAATVSDAIKDIPNVIFTDSVGAPIIRGQDTQGPNYGGPAFFAGTIPRATVNLDGHYLNFYEYVYGGTSIWDVESIEVFRGPQTTSQGANAIAGAIIVNTKDPTFTPEGAYQAEIGNINRKRASLAASGPLVKNQLAVRLALDYWGRDSFIDYTSPSFTQGETDLDFESFNLRTKVLWVPDGLPGLKTKITYAHTYNNRPTYETATQPYDDLNNTSSTWPSWNQNSDMGVLDIDYDFGNGMGINNQTQYADNHVERVTEPRTNGAAEVDQKNLSNDMRLSFGDMDSSVAGVAGLYLARTTSDDVLYLRGTSDFDDEKNNLGLYSEATYRFAERWAITAGLRFQRDQVERSGTSPFARVTTLDYDESSNAWLPKLSLAYDLTPDVTVGALVNRGYNPGGVNLSFVTGEYVTFDEETVWNYEMFARAGFLGNRLFVNGNLFYSDYKDSQRVLPEYLNGVQYGTYVVNADSAKSYGIELSIDYLVLPELRIKAGAGLLETEVGRFTVAEGAVYEGNEYSRAPGHMLSLGIDWDIVSALRLSCDVRHTDGYYSTDENDPAYEVDDYTVANARISYAFNNYLQPYVFVNNIFDERTPTYLYDHRTAGGIVANMLEPRAYGIGIKGTF